MMPVTSSMRELRTMVERMSRKNVTSNAPANPAAMTSRYPHAPDDIMIMPFVASITIATPRLAPFVIPSTEGPAKGLWNSV